MLPLKKNKQSITVAFIEMMITSSETLRVQEQYSNFCIFGLTCGYKPITPGALPQKNNQTSV